MFFQHDRLTRGGLSYQEAIRMIAQAERPKRRHTPRWHVAFIDMLPEITRYAKSSFRDLDPEAREDLAQETVANCLVSFVRLVERGKQSAASARTLAMFAVRQIKDGRRVGKRSSVKDVYDIHARAKGGYQLCHIGSSRDQCVDWRSQLIENKRTSPADLAAFKLDFNAWLPSLSRRDRRVAEDLAMGERTGDVANKFGVSPSRVSQLRRQLQESWEQFIEDPGECAVKVVT